MLQLSRHTKHTVLIVDDEPSIIETLRMLLRSEEYEVLSTPNGQEALHLMELALPCMVLADVYMPIMDGLTLCKRIKQNPQTAHIPVMLISGMAEQADVDKGMEAGAVDFIRKPFVAAELSMRIRSQIRLHEALHYNASLIKRLDAIGNAALDAIIMMDHNGKVSMWNSAAERLFGYTQQEALGQTLHTLVADSSYLEKHKQAFARFQKTGQGAAVGKTLEMEARHKDGHFFPVELSLSSIQFDDHWSAVGIVRDIADRKKNEEILRSEEDRFRQVFHSVTEGILLADPHTRQFVMANTRICSMLGYSEQEMHALSVEDIHPAQDLPTVVEAFKRQFNGEIQLAPNLPMLRKDGSVFYCDISSTKVTFDGRDLLLGCFRDVTDRRLLEADLAHARKLEAVGQLAAGIAHEINTPAQFVNDSIHFLKEAYEDWHQLHEQYRQAIDQLAQLQANNSHPILDKITQAEEEADLEYLEENISPSFEQCLEGLSRISSIVRAMKEFAHPEQAQKSSADINKALESTLTLAKNEYKYVADIELELGNLPPIMCNIGDINQVFLNLIVNGAHAIADKMGDSGQKGSIRIRTAQDGDSVQIEIEDTGSGIPQQVQDRIFDPFFTTKEVGRGSGQGLAISRSIIVEKHQGTITFDTAVGKGTTFVLNLPINHSQAT